MSDELQDHTASQRFCWRIAEIAACVLVILLPLAPLCLTTHRPKVNDWENNIWAIGYTAEYLGYHGAFPAVFNTEHLAGHPAPVFYGPLLYPMLALPSVVLGAEGGLRLSVVAMWALQFVLVRRVALLASGGHRFLAIAAGALMCWAVYPLTNLYNRGAIAEFFATSLLLCAACAGTCALLESKRGLRIAFVLLCGWCGAASAGAHAITAMVGGFTLACLSVPALFLHLTRGARSLFWRIAVVSALFAGVVVVLSPWLYAVLHFLGRFRVAYSQLTYIPEFDSLLARVWPVPFDNRAARFLGDAATPYLDAQLNVALLLLLVGAGITLFRSRWKRQFVSLLVVAMILFGMMFVVSVFPQLGSRLPRQVGGTIQFAYRLVTYQNFTLFAALVAMLMMLRAAGKTVSVVPIALALLLGLGALGVKLHHAVSEMKPIEPGVSNLLAMPSTYYGWNDFAISDPAQCLPPNTPAVFTQIPPGDGPLFGQDGSFVISAPDTALVVLNVLAFPWNQVLRDDQLVPESELRTTPDYWVLLVPPGSHKLEYRFLPPLRWSTLRLVSALAFGGWTLVTLTAFVACVMSRLLAEEESAPSTSPVDAARRT